MNSPLSDLSNVKVVWDSDKLAAALDPDDEEEDGVEPPLDKPVHAPSFTQRGKHSLPEDEPRDPLTGEWIHGAGSAVEDVGKLAKEAKTTHFDTSHGPWVMTATPATTTPGHVHVAWPASKGKPITMDLTPKEANELGHAIDHGGAAIDEYLSDGEPGNKLVSRKRVKLGGRTVTVSAFVRPDDNDGDVRFESPGWTLEIPVTESEYIQTYLWEGAEDGRVFVPDPDPEDA